VTGSAAGAPARTAARRTVASVRAPALVAPLAVLAVGLGLWQLGAFHAIFGLKTFTVPYPSAILAGWQDNGSVIVEAAGATLPAAVLGYVLGMSLGLALATILLLSAPRLIDRVLPFLSATNSLPIVALAPLVALFTGPGVPLKIIVVAIMTTPIMVVYAIRGLRDVDPTAVELMASLEATPNQLYRMVRIRTALPFVFTALKSSIVLALIGTIVAESVRGFEGLGFVIVESMGSFKAVEAWLALIAIAGIGIGWYLLVEVLERLAIPWEAGRRRHA
jgi:NitT/TauT family transport system permease protein